ncbi:MULTISPECIES: hypothetical protein [unclassified Polynucleobacter]|uniref:hypothetical protein n=1 Tax=unclassified Polynucleobacter TaxID=2640945 RepID=UPI0025EF9956|nr:MULTISPECIES: hypothetical protein [unclassified Polynucleobacter]
MATPHPSDSAVISSAIILSILVPLQISLKNPRIEPFIVKATIDAAIIAGLPASKAARKYALVSQTPETLAMASSQAPEIVSGRRLFFRRYF